MTYNAKQSWIFIILLCNFLLTGTSILAQEVYFAEDPPMVLDGKNKHVSDFIIEYSAKNNGFIELELWQNSTTVVAKSAFIVKKRGSNTAKMYLDLAHPTKTLSPGSFYQYKLTLYENTITSQNVSNSANQMDFTRSINSNIPKISERKKVGKTLVITGVKVL